MGLMEVRACRMQTVYLLDVSGHGLVLTLATIL